MSEIDKRIALMHDYLQYCVDKRDYHGCMDAAADIRELLIEKKVLEDHKRCGYCNSYLDKRNKDAS